MSGAIIKQNHSVDIVKGGYYRSYAWSHFPWFGRRKYSTIPNLCFPHAFVFLC